MKNCLKLTIMLVFISLSLSCSINNQERAITFKTLLEELVSREMLSQHPDGLWTMHQSSSYERLSVTSEDSEGWYANHDWNHFERIEENNGRSESCLLA